mmetsp:Transcript_19410/g.61757  ORF Transcript_19410/g.61757 Transcript_19410/m.61757 type:complete len:181 (-) Transcript_19410:59-601(-)
MGSSSSKARCSVFLADCEFASEEVIDALGIRDASQPICGPGPGDAMVGEWEWEHLDIRRARPAALVGAKGTARAKLAYGESGRPPAADLVMVVMPAKRAGTESSELSSVAAFLCPAQARTSVWLVLTGGCTAEAEQRAQEQWAAVEGGLGPAERTFVLGTPADRHALLSALREFRPSGGE